MRSNIEILYEFLGEELFTEFEAEYYYDEYTLVYISVCDYVNQVDYLDEVFNGAFLWQDSPKGHNFWSKKAAKFKKYLTNKRK